MDRDAAIAWILAHGRDLERALLGHAWRNGSIDAVIAALEAYRCADGGYGRGLEPDAAQPQSSVIDTCAALAVHRRIGTPGDHSTLRSAIAWLAAHGDYWPLVTLTTGGARAPWFSGTADEVAQRFHDWQINPAAEVLGFLLEYGSSLGRNRLRAIEVRLMAAIAERSDALDMHEVLSVASLMRSSACPRRLRKDLSAIMDRNLQRLFTEPQAGYRMRPNMLVEGAGDPLSSSIDQRALQNDIDLLATEQESDGAWRPQWSWASDSAAWQEAKRAWASILTERNLRVCSLLP